MDLIIKDVKKRFGNVIALSDATVSVQSGEVRALVGGNGSGKSTLAKILGGVVAKDDGEITIDGKDYEVASPVHAKKLGVIMTSQELSLLPNLSIVQNICLCNMDSIKGTPFLDRKKMEKRTMEVLRLIGKEHLIDRKISTLPANEQYLLELAKALVQKPKIIIMDEITSALYKNDVKQVKKIINQLRDDGTIVLFISHRLNEVFDLCDSISVLRNGLTVGTFTKEELSENQLISHMSGREITDIGFNKKKNTGESDHPIAFESGDIYLKEFDKNVSLTVKKGEYIGVAGLDGQGQTTFLRNMFGLYKAIHPKLDGEEIVINSPNAAIKKGIAFVTGDRDAEGTFKERSIAENLTTVKQLVLRETLDDVDAELKKNGVKYNNAKDLITSLSGGNQQKVVVSRWTAMKPKLILADDPTKGIDIQSRRDLHTTFAKLIGEGSSVVMISSDDEELVEACSIMPLARVIVMYEGEIVQMLHGEDITIENIAAYSAGKTN